MTMQNRQRLLKRLAAIQGRPRAAIKAALAQGADQIVATAKNFVPKDSGDLAASIGATFGDYKAANPNVRGVGAGGGGDPDLSVTIHAGDAKAFYAAFVEHGTAPHTAGGKFAGAKHPGTAAQPFFYPAYRVNKRSVKTRVTRAARKAIKDAANV